MVAECGRGCGATIRTGGDGARWCDQCGWEAKGPPVPGLNVTNLCVLVCGGRGYVDNGAMFRVLDRLHDERGIVRVVTGGATGADALAARWANEQGVSLAVYPADWTAHGKAAGPIRNQQMLDAEAPDLVLAFPGGRGTADMVRRARKAGAWVTIYGGAT